MIRRLGTMAVIEPFQQGVSRTDDRARLCLDTHRPTAPFSTPFAAICGGVFGVCLQPIFEVFGTPSAHPDGPIGGKHGPVFVGSPAARSRTTIPGGGNPGR